MLRFFFFFFRNHDLAQGQLEHTPCSKDLRVTNKKLHQTAQVTDRHVWTLESGEVNILFCSNTETNLLGTEKVRLQLK